MIEYNRCFTDKRIRIGEVRFVNVNVFPAADAADVSGPYAADLLFSKSDTGTVEIVKTAIRAAQETEHDRLPLLDGDLIFPDVPAYAGKYILHATSAQRPSVCVLEGGKIREALDGEDFYSGCHGAATLNFYHYNLHGIPGVFAALGNVIKTREGQEERTQNDYV